MDVRSISARDVGQMGEYLIAAELCRRGYTATTFTRNMPHYDIIAMSKNGMAANIQVKTSKESSWQFDLTKHCEVLFEGKRQVLGKKFDPPVSNLLMVFVNMKEQGSDQIYIMTYRQFQNILVDHHSEYLKKHGGIRPRNFKSTHSQLKVHHFDGFQDNWNLVEGVLSSTEAVA